MNPFALAQTRTPARHAKDTGHALTAEVQARRSRDTRFGSPSRARYAGRSLHSPDGRTPAKGRGMRPLSVTPTLAPDEADDTAISARKSLAGSSGCGHRSAAVPLAARDGRDRLRRDGPGSGLASCSGRSSSSRLHSRRTRASLVVLALLALVVAPGTIFAVAAGPESDLAPVRGLRRLAQTTSGGGVEYPQRAKLTASDAAADDRFGRSVSIDGDTMVTVSYTHLTLPTNREV